MSEKIQAIKLPAPELSGDISLEEALQNRRSVRAFSLEPLNLQEVSQLLWSAQGITSDWGGRTAPSAGALYPLEIYLISGQADGLQPGVYKYVPDGHILIKIREGDFREGLASACLGQSWISDAPVSLVIAAVYERVTVKYDERGMRYVHIEAGHAAQNVCLQATALDLGAVTVGAFDDNKVKSFTGLAKDEMPLYVIPVGKQE